MRKFKNKITFYLSEQFATCDGNGSAAQNAGNIKKDLSKNGNITVCKMKLNIYKNVKNHKTFI